MSESRTIAPSAAPASPAPWAAARERVRTYFDSTATRQWADLTSDVPVSGIRRTVRAGRDAMRAALLSWLPPDLSGRRLLDAGCGTGALAVEAARRGAEVVAIDVAGQLVDIGRNRAPARLAIDWRVGDMLDDRLGAFDHIVAMDSLIHYAEPQLLAAVTRLRERAVSSLLFTFAPATPLLTAMHLAGGLFPRADRAPAIVPVPPRRIEAALAPSRMHRIASGFYTSQAAEVRP